MKNTKVIRFWVKKGRFAKVIILVKLLILWGRMHLSNALIAISEKIKPGSKEEGGK